jgi:threonine synthase
LRGHGIKSVAEDSSGNGGAALATYAAAHRMHCRIYIPATTSEGKTAQIAATGAAVEAIAGPRDAVTEAAMNDSSGAYYASHNRHPMFLLGMKTVGYEIWEQLGYKAPDIIVVPVGGGSNVVGCYRAFSELKASGLILQLPKIVGIQSQACDPLARAFATGAGTLPAVTPQKTIAEGIALGAPVRGVEALCASRKSGGTIISVPEADIRAAYFDLAAHGFYVEPTSATAAAGLRALCATDLIASAQTIVVILTGTGLKTGSIARDAGIY